jgi:hypothetical protein
MMQNKLRIVLIGVLHNLGEVDTAELQIHVQKSLGERINVSHGSR